MRTLSSHSGAAFEAGSTGRATIGGVQVNFIAEFDGARTDLALEANEYDPSPSANYESWLLLEPIPMPAPAPAASA